MQDTFEKLGDQVQDTVQGLKDLVAGGNDQASGESGIEQLSGQNDPNQPKAASGAGPQPAEQIAQKRAEEQEAVKFHREQVSKWGDDYKRMQEEDNAEKRKKDEEEKKKEEQRIFQLQEQDARTAVLNPVKPKQGRGTAFLPPSAKQSMGTGELSKTPTN